MVFLYPQTQHPLIPKAYSPEENLALAEETKNFRQGFFQLLGQEIQARSDTNAKSDDSEVRYRSIRSQLDSNPEIQAAHERRKILQDRLWDRVAIDLQEDSDRLFQEFKSYLKTQNQGTLVLNPDLEYPRHQLKVDIHRMPGGYLQDRDPSDFWTGAVYDHGVFLYGQGWFGGLNDELGHTVINQVLLKNYPELNPHKILDMGCSVGHSTLPYAAQYPDAEVWGIDLGASLLRYASARAKALNIKVNFAQQNAEKTELPDNSFDLVVSHILLHEIPCGARKKVFAESYRLLKPGGVMVHLESQLFLSPPSFLARYFRDTEVWVNSEPYLGSSKLEDLQAYVIEAGVKPENFKINCVPGYFSRQRGDNNSKWIVFSAKKL